MEDLSLILQRIPQLSVSQSLVVEELTGGITNRNYKITTDTDCFVLRLGGNEPPADPRTACPVPR